MTSGNGRASRTPQISLAEAAQLELSLFSLKTRYSGSAGNQCMQIYYCLDQQNQHVFNYSALPELALSFPSLLQQTDNANIELHPEHTYLAVTVNSLFPKGDTFL